jgi:hypothetical protein
MDRRAGTNLTKLLEAAAHVAADDGRLGDAALFRAAGEAVTAVFDSVEQRAPSAAVVLAAQARRPGKPAAPEHRHKYGASGMCMIADCGAMRRNKPRAVEQPTLPQTAAGAQPMLDMP